jgi:pyruvate,water dikinase
MNDLVIRGERLRAAPPGLLGGKAALLVRLRELGQPVPSFYVISTEALKREDLGPELVETLLRVHAAEFPGDEPVAVRSSMAGEDGPDRSFAGIHESVLSVRGRDGLLDAIRRVRASAHGLRARAYGGRAAAPAVIVQRMIAARASGVLFTIDPVRRDPGLIVINSIPGTGEALVSGAESGDSFEVRKDSLAVERRLAGAHPSLSDDEVRQAARVGLALEAALRGPQDIEFCIDAGGAFHLLQARPVTGLAVPVETTIWDNSNIFESYAGVTSTMTFSFIRHAYAIVYRCFLEVMGVPPRTVERHRAVTENMLGHIQGRVYYNLKNWYRLVRLFPGYRYNKAFMEAMMGVKEPFDLGDEGPPPGLLRRTFVELPSLLRLLAGMAWKFIRIRAIVRRFEERFRRHYAAWSALDLRAKEPKELLRLYEEMEAALLWNWKAPVVNDFFVMIAYGVLRALCRAWCGDAAESLQNDLLSGQGEIASAEPTRRMLELAQEARRDPVLWERLRETPSDVLARELPADPRFAGFAAMLERYLRDHGLRCPNELKLEEPTLRDRPDRVFDVLKLYRASAATGGLDAVGEAARAREIRARAEARALGSLGLVRRGIFRVVLGSARLGVRQRENLRLARTQVYGLLREILRAVAARFVRDGVLDRPEDLFDLTLDEMWDFVRGSGADLRALAAARRREFDAYRAAPPPPDRFETRGALAPGRGPAAPDPGEPRRLRGTACSPGIREDTVVVVRTPGPDLALAGQILAAERTDPGWVVYYPCVSGLLIERGSVLSHSCIVAREMGIPTIVRIPGLLARLRTGQRVRMNGADGTVELLDDPQRTSSSSNPP